MTGAEVGLTDQDKEAILCLLAGARLTGIEIARKSILFLYGAAGLTFAESTEQFEVMRDELGDRG